MSHWTASRCDAWNELALEEDWVSVIAGLLAAGHGPKFPGCCMLLICGIAITSEGVYED